MKVVIATRPTGALASHRESIEMPGSPAA